MSQRTEVRPFLSEHDFQIAKRAFPEDQTNFRREIEDAVCQTRQFLAGLIEHRLKIPGYEGELDDRDEDWATRFIYGYKHVFAMLEVCGTFDSLHDSNLPERMTLETAYLAQLMKARVAVIVAFVHENDIAQDPAAAIFLDDEMKLLDVRRPSIIPHEVWQVMIKEANKDSPFHCNDHNEVITDCKRDIEGSLRDVFKYPNSPIMENDWALNSLQSYQEVMARFYELGRLGPNDDLSIQPCQVPLVVMGFHVNLISSLIACTIVGNDPMASNEMISDNVERSHPLYGRYLPGEFTIRRLTKLQRTFQELLGSLVRYEYFLRQQVA
ncbi:hypothetical protein BO70DRAFT_392198 [Aspergillus heteromorphus CBS 117.55]|uniref:Uncharacterized protein n=1 Tax=Aspergillus heteromorphus CBS 117.55 TaxID=1448321 RepID=A0A317X7G5_9EURO|nr:uncharacterized protein BO70DRAFT_392198 [Aspergillus heteromorphus CBS 117.55]PWY92818.1 hypothetical protein BO70DRAFT_392198 [Aspergillus heteromorphus CBS 117.55]